MARRQHLTLMVVLAVFLFLSLSYMFSGSDGPDSMMDQRPRPPPPSQQRPPQKEPSAPAKTVVDGPAKEHKPTKAAASHTQPLETPTAAPKPEKEPETKIGEGHMDLGFSQDILTGGAIAPKLENATAKAELGRASWKLFHTMMARFPDKPTKDDSAALAAYVRLFARLYPCGDCARHFQQLLEKYPPQVSSRRAAAGWACFVHNEVNERLGKDQFDCNNIGDFYDCGCGDEDGEKKGEGKGDDDGKGDVKAHVKEPVALAGEEKPATKLELEKEGLTKGG